MDGSGLPRDDVGQIRADVNFALDCTIMFRGYTAARSAVNAACRGYRSGFISVSFLVNKICRN